MTEQLTMLPELSGDYVLPILGSLVGLIAAVVVYFLLVRTLGRLAIKGLISYQLHLTLNRLSRGLIVIIVLLIVLGLFGISVSSFWAALSGILVLVALGFVAVWSVLSNVLCSVLLVIFSPFRIGDEIEVMDTGSAVTMRGKVIDINMFFTSLETASPQADEQQTDKIIVRVPNNQFFQKYVRRWPGEQTSSLKHYLADEYKRNRE